MDFDTKQNKVKFNQSDVRVLTEASAKFKHIRKLDPDNSAAVGLIAVQIAVEIDEFLNLVVVPGVRAAKKAAQAAPVAAPVADKKSK